MRMHTVGAVALFCAIGVMPAAAHHGWSGYDASKELTLTAKATVVGYPNRSNADEMRAERITIDGATVELR